MEERSNRDFRIIRGIDMKICRHKWIWLIFILFLASCATSNCYIKPGTDFSQYKNIAVVKFDCLSDPTVGQEVADTVLLEFIKKGYNVIERSQLRSIIDEEILVQSGLTESNKSALQIRGIDAIVIGSVSNYNCRPSQAPIYYMGMLLGVLNTNLCHASLSIKMIVVNTGNIVWCANGSHSINAVGMTANKVMQEVMKKISKEIPEKSFMSAGPISREGNIKLNQSTEPSRVKKNKGHDDFKMPSEYMPGPLN